MSTCYRLYALSPRTALSLWGFGKLPCFLSVPLTVSEAVFRPPASSAFNFSLMPERGLLHLISMASGYKLLRQFDDLSLRIFRSTRIYYYRKTKFANMYFYVWRFFEKELCVKSCSACDNDNQKSAELPQKLRGSAFCCCQFMPLTLPTTSQYAQR